MKTLFTLLISLLYLLPAAGQEPTMLSLNVIGGNGADEIASPVTETADGGFILSIGTTSTTGPIVDSFCNTYSQRIIFVKYNSDASVPEWSKCYKNNWSDTGYIYIFPTMDEGYILGGECHSGMQWLIHKEDALGNIIWSKAYGASSTQELSSMITTSDGGYIMFGDSYSNDGDVGFHYGSLFDADFWVLRLDSLGNKLWSKVIGGTGDEAAYKVIAAPANGCYIVGRTSSNDYDCTGNHGGDNDAYVARLDANGNIMWHKDMGGSGNDGGNYAWPDGKGGIIIAAMSGSSDGDVTHQINPGGYNIWVIDVDSNGNILWNNCYGGGGNEYPNAICKAIDGSIWIACMSKNRGGEIDNAYGSYDAWFVHADSVGNFINAKVLGSSRQDEGYMIYPLSNGNVIGGGYYEDSSGAFSNIFYGENDAFLAIFAPQTTGITSIQKANNEVKIFPNPSDEYVTIETAINDNYSIIISDVMGQIIYKASFIDKTKIAVNEWQRGLYYVQVINGSGYKEVQKLIVE